MFECFYPDEYLDSIESIDFQKLYEQGLRGVLFDIDNTLVPHGAPADAHAPVSYTHLDQQIEELTDRVKRQMAEFDNYRKRTDKEKAAMFEVGAKSVIEKVLPVVDNFERGLAAVPEDQKGSPFAEGMEKIYKQLMTVLEELEVKPIEALGKEFDPNLHNARCV